MHELHGISGVTATLGPKQAGHIASRNKMAPLTTHKLNDIQIVLGLEFFWACDVKELFLYVLNLLGRLCKTVPNTARTRGI